MTDPADKFVWPPGRATLPAPRGAIASTRQAIRPRRPAGWLRSALLDIERTWLGLETPPLADRLRESGWRPDDVAAYCRRCGETVGPNEADDTGCSLCRGQELPWSRLVRLGEFRDLLREMVLEVKFTRWRRLGNDLGRLLGSRLIEVMDADGVSAHRSVLVPIPMSARRRIARGIDHAGVMARGISAETGIPVVRALWRKHGPSQTRIPGTQRRVNVEGRVLWKEGVDISGFHVILVDDVATTRATLGAACRAVMSARKALGDSGKGVVWGAVIGVTPGKRLGGGDVKRR